MLKPEIQNITIEDENRWLASGIHGQEPVGPRTKLSGPVKKFGPTRPKRAVDPWLGSNNRGFGSSRFITFWTQMTRFNQTHFHNKTSIFHQSIFNVPDFAEIVLSNEHGRLR